MSRIERAVALLRAAVTAYTPNTSTNDNLRPFLVYLAETLNNAGLLAPDTPKTGDTPMKEDEQ